MCELCRKQFPVLATHLNRIHKISGEEYLKRFPKASLCSDSFRKNVSNSAKEKFLQDPTLRRKVSSRTFDLIENKKLVTLLQRDHKSAKICLEKSLWKPAIILYGSIIEAILREKFPESKDFYTALESAYKYRDVSKNEYHRICIIKDLRNFVHLHKELEEDEEINEYWAKTFADICESIIKRYKK